MRSEAWPAAKAPKAPETATDVPLAPSEPETAGWEARFAWGLYHSKRACGGESSRWALDQHSRAGVPSEMLRAEELLQMQGLPAEQQRQKTAERVGGHRCSTLSDVHRVPIGHPLVLS